MSPACSYRTSEIRKRTPDNWRPYSIDNKFFMSHIEIAVNGAKKIESFLVQSFGATGRGLHEKLTSVEKKIPHALQKQIRYVASVRNSIVHETHTHSMQNPAAFEATVAQILSQLKQQSESRDQKPSTAAAAPTSKAPSSGGIVSSLTENKAAPLFFLLGGAIGSYIGIINQIGVIFTIMLGLWIGAIAAMFSRIVCILLGFGIAASLVYIAYDYLSAS